MRGSGWLVVASLVMVGVAGCVETPRQSTDQPGVTPCPGQAYVSLHFDQVLDELELGEALSHAGYTWYPNGGTRFSSFVNSARDIEGLISVQPGISAAEPAGNGTLITVQERTPGSVGALRINDTAEEVESIVRERFGADVVQVIRGQHTAHCDPAPGV